MGGVKWQLLKHIIFLREVQTGTLIRWTPPNGCQPCGGSLFVGVVMKKILLTQGQFALVDDEDFEWLNQWKWCAAKRPSGTFYAKRRQWHTNSGYENIVMHRLIIDAGIGQDTDHRNGNGLDNRRCNLRAATSSQNNMNRHKIRGVSKYKGVTQNRNKWRACLVNHRKKVYLGVFETEIEAAKAYDAKAKELFGEFARLNLE
jgi:hypothetical protein